MTLLEYYLNPGTAAVSSTTILGVTQWKAKFVSGAIYATGSSTTTTTTSLEFVNSLYVSFAITLAATTTTSGIEAYAQQYPAGNGNTYFSPLVNDIVEELIGIIDNSAGVDKNLILFCIDIDLDGDFDE